MNDDAIQAIQLLLTETLGWKALALALLMFWIVGALRRLKRLRQDALAAFVPVAQQFDRVIKLVEQARPYDSTSVPEQAALQAMQTAAQILGRDLTQVRRYALHVGAVTQLSTQWKALSKAWQGWQRQKAPNKNAQDIDDSSVRAWEKLRTVLLHEAAGFDETVLQFNRASTQWPARLIVRALNWQLGGQLLLEQLLPTEAD